MTLLAAISWDPTVRGLLIVLTAMVILTGSVFLLLSTNLGARVGFLLALTGFFGWMTVQGIVWTVFAQGNKGPEPHWAVQEVITGDIRETTVDALDDFPASWIKLEEGDRILGDAQAAADKVLAPPAEGAEEEHGGGGGEEKSEAHLEPVFKEATDYVPIGGYRKGGETWFFTLRHKPHYAVVQVRPVIEQTPVPGAAPPRPRPDTSKPVTSVIMVRDLGSVRFPPFVLALSSAIIFGVLVNVLHRRDKEIMAARAAA